MELRFYKCLKCGQIVAIVKSTNVPIKCCGDDMVEIRAGSVDAAKEKHVPVVSVKDNIVTVKVGSIEHPMSDEHFIEWIAIQTKFGNQRKALTPSSKPEASFAIVDGDSVVAAYAYCNLHGLWKCE